MLSSHVNKPGMCAMYMCLSLRRWPHRPGEWLPTLDISLLPPAGAVELLLATCLANAVININITRPKPAYGWQGLAGSWGQDTDQIGTLRNQENYLEPWKTTWNLEKNIKKRPGTLKIDVEPWKTIKTDLELYKTNLESWKTIKQPGTIKTDLEPWIYI